MSVLCSAGQQLDGHEVGCRHDRRAHLDSSTNEHTRSGKRGVPNDHTR